jgi:O-antigen ligase
LALACSYTTPVQRAGMALWGVVMAITSWVPLVRSALVATLVEACGFLWFMGRGSLALALVLIAAAGALILPPTRTVIFEAVRPLSSGSYYELATGRGVLFAAQVIAFQRATPVQKLIGRGLHSTQGINRQFAPMLLEESGNTELDEGNVGAHNQYLRVLTESGILGILVFATVLVLSFRDAVRAAFRSTRTIDRTAGMGVLLLLFAMCLYGLSGTPLDLPSIAWPTWFAVGMASGIEARQSRPPEGIA